MPSITLPYFIEGHSDPPSEAGATSPGVVFLLACGISTGIRASLFHSHQKGQQRSAGSCQLSLWIAEIALRWISSCAGSRRPFFAVTARMALEDVLSDRACRSTTPLARQPVNALGHIEAANVAGRTLGHETAR
jgi:hypothetical protein